VLASIRFLYPWLRHIFADSGYAGAKLRGALRRSGRWTVEIIKRSDTAKERAVEKSNEEAVEAKVH
jgi:transposase